MDDALARLASLDAQPGTAHVEAFAAVHQRLRSLLDELDARPSTGEIGDDQAEQA